MNKLLKFRFKTLQSKLIAIFLAISLAPLAIIGYTASRTCSNTLLEANSELLQNAASETLDKIYRNLFERYGDVQAFAFNPVARGEADEVAAALNFYTTTYGCYDLMIVADLDGKVIAANTVGFDGKPLNTASLIGESVAGQKWFQECMDGSIKVGECAFFDAERDSTVERFIDAPGLTLNFSAPIFDETGKVVRVWSNRASFERTAGSIMKQQREFYQEKAPSTETQILNQNGLVLDDYDSATVLTLNLAEKGLVAAQEIAKGESGVSTQVHLRRLTPQVNAYATSKGALGFPGYGWGVMVRQDYDEIIGAAVSLSRFFILSGIIATIIVGFVGWWLSRRIAGPIRSIASGLESIAAGDLTGRIEVSSSDEIGVLGRALNQTAEGISNALAQESVDWDAVGKQREINADYSGQIAAINRAQAVIEFDLQGNILSANDNFLKTLGYTLDEVKGRHHSMFVDESYRNSAAYREFWPNLAKGVVSSGEFKRIGKGGKEVWIQAGYNPILSAEGVPVKVVEFASDTTAQKLAEVEFRSKVNSILEVVEAASSGDLTRDITVRGEDAVGQMGEGLERFFADLRNSISSIAENASALAGASEELSAVSSQMSGNAEETSSQANVVSAASEQVSMNVQTVSTGVEELNAAIREIAKNASDAARVSQQAVSVAESTNGTISKLGDSSVEIGKVVKVITSIAEQTNLLALNATIEAARAGEAGKGFAVVANEVKELAKETAKATEDISQKIDAIQTDTQGAVEAIREISGVINQINDISNTIASAVEEQTATANEMGRNVAEAARGASEIAQNITSVANAAESTTQGAGNSQQAASELSRMAADLQELVNRFKYHKAELLEHAKPARVGAPVSVAMPVGSFQSV